MESITKVSMSVCPFVRSTSTQALRQLSQTSGALANQARQCPIAGNAIRAKEISIRSYSSATNQPEPPLLPFYTGGHFQRYFIFRTWK